MAETTKKTPRSSEKGIPAKVRSGLETQAKQMGLKFVAEEDGSRCSFLEGDNVIGGPYTHGQSAQSFLDGYRLGEYKGKAVGKADGLKEGHRTALKVLDQPVQLLIMKTGLSFWGFVLKNNNWDRIEHPNLPSLNYGSAVEVAWKSQNCPQKYVVEFDDRSSQVNLSS